MMDTTLCVIADVCFSTDNRMADLLDILSRSSDVKVVCQCQVKLKI